MQREIKFRVWNPIKKKMCDDILYDRKYMRGDMGITSINYAINEEIRSGNAIMQYTGLEDFNGKEIYESDILFSEQFSGKNMVIVEFSIKEIVKYGHGESYFYLWSGFTVSAYRNKKPSDLKVIGNIYENPELLENEKCSK